LTYAVSKHPFAGNYVKVTEVNSDNKLVKLNTLLNDNYDSY